MNPHELKWDSVKRCVPDISLTKEHDKSDYFSPRGRFPLSSTPPPQIRRQEPPVNPPSPDFKYTISSELNAMKSELLAVIKQQHCQCRSERDVENPELETLVAICQQLKDLKSELNEVKGKLQKLKPEPVIELEARKVETCDKGVQVEWLVSDQGTQTPRIPLKQQQQIARQDFVPPPPVVDCYLPQNSLPMVPKPQSVPQSEMSIAANKILKKYLPDEPLPAEPPQNHHHQPQTPRWRPTDYDNLIFNMTNVSVAMQRPRNEPPWAGPTPPRFQENWQYRQPAPRNPMDEFDDPDVDWWSNRPRPNLVDLSAIMNQPKLL